MDGKILSDNILELNRDMEPAIIQGGYGRSMFFKDQYKNLQFVHFADVHAVADLWDRIVEYINYYDEYIDFAIHTGDYCGGNQEVYVDFYKDCTPCKKVIYNCVGNHDTIVTAKWIKTEKDRPHSLLFNHTENWDVNFMDIEYSMTYYKDFPEANIRLVVHDLYYDLEVQKKWLKDLLDKSIEEGINLITAMHELTDDIVEKPETTFNSIEKYKPIEGETPKTVFEDIVADFIDAGGNFVCNLAGHYHHDIFGYTKRGVLNIAVECATDWYHWCDGRRVKGTRTYDCFNVMAVDVNLGTIKITRIGNNIDNYLRIKRTMCFDYKNKQMIF